MSCSTSQARLTCLCGQVNASGSLLSSPQIPISMKLCHCNPCRRTSGALATSFPALKSAPPRVTLDKCRAYQSSATQTRYFCRVCGAKCFVEDKVDDSWYCAGGIIEKDPTRDGEWPKNTIEITRHEYVEDTKDGGLAPLLTFAADITPAWRAAAPEDVENLKTGDLSQSTIRSFVSTSAHLSPPTEDDCLKAECQCGETSLLIRRANNSKQAANVRHVRNDLTRFKSYMCACRSCRLASGVSLVPWSLIPVGNIFTSHGELELDHDSHATFDKLQHHPVDFGPSGDSPFLTHYMSSSAVTRTFCAKCGCSVSYFSTERPYEVDIATGILRAEEGSMARRWLDWEWGRCSFSEEAVDKSMWEAWTRSKEVMHSYSSAKK